MNQTTADIFTRIYTESLWSHGETCSGWESTMTYTRTVRNELPGLLAQFGVKTLLDAGCGDHNWFSALLLEPRMDVDYIGMDCVAPLIEDMQARFGQYGRRQFVLGDLCEDSLPQADLMLVRDVMIYLDQDQRLALLNNFVNSGIPLLMATSYVSDDVVNGQGLCGEQNRYNLSLAPYNLPSGGVAVGIMDFLPGDHVRYLTVWTREQVAAALGR